jgi:hypothetical protein
MHWLDLSFNMTPFVQKDEDELGDAVVNFKYVLQKPCTIIKILIFRTSNQGSRRSILCDNYKKTNSEPRLFFSSFGMIHPTLP